jgi:hypothetical protein
MPLTADTFPETEAEIKGKQSGCPTGFSPLF